MKKIIIAIFVAEFFLFWPLFMQGTGLMYPDDDVDYFAHASSLVFGQFPSYKKEYLMTSQQGPQCAIGSGILAAPFVYIFSFLDNAGNSSIMESRTAQNVPKSWANFGFIFSSVFYFTLGCVLLYRASSLVISPIYAIWAIILMAICQGLPLYAFRRPIFSHIPEFFMQSVFIYLFIRNEIAGGQFVKKWWSFMLLGAGAALIFLIRPNNVCFSIVWPLLILSQYRSSGEIKNILDQLFYVFCPFILMILVFKTWPENYNHYLIYPNPFSYVTVQASWLEILKRLWYVFFGPDWGLVYTAPFCLLGFWGLPFLDIRWKNRYLLAMLPLVVNFYTIVFFGTQGGWYGYRYFIASAFPLFIIPLAFLFEWLNEKKGSFWMRASLLIALMPVMSMWFFQGDPIVKMRIIPQFFGRSEWGIDSFQISVWQLVFHIDKLFHISLFGGIGYIRYLFYAVVHRNQVIPSFNLRTLIEVVLLYMLPFVVGWVLKNNVQFKKGLSKEKQLQNGFIYKIQFLGAITGALLIAGFITIRLFGGHKDNDYQYLLLSRSKIVSASQFDEAVKISNDKTLKAVELFKDDWFQPAVDELNDAINICPVNTTAYRLLTLAYLKSGREQEMYDVINKSGDSFADFNKIIEVIDDADLDKIPLEGPQDNIYLAQFPQNKKMAISFMFDGGEANVYDNLNIFEKRGFRATIPIIAGFVGSSPQWGTWEEWKDAADRGFEIANHSMYHRDLSKLSGKDLNVSINQADALIENKIGHEVTAFVFPEGRRSSVGIAHALQVSEVIRSMDFLRPFYSRTIGIVYGGPYFSINTANRMIDIGIKRRLWILAKGQGITANPGQYSFKPIDPSLLDAHLSYIHSKSNDVYVDTFSNIFEYLKLRQNIKIEIKNYSSNSADFVLYADTREDILTRPLTVVLKAKVGPVVSALTANGRKLKTWVCDVDKLCVDVNSNNENIHVQW